MGSWDSFFKFALLLNGRQRYSTFGNTIRQRYSAVVQFKAMPPKAIIQLLNQTQSDYTSVMTRTGLSNHRWRISRLYPNLSFRPRKGRRRRKMMSKFPQPQSFQFMRQLLLLLLQLLQRQTNEPESSDADFYYIHLHYFVQLMRR